MTHATVIDSINTLGFMMNYVNNTDITTRKAIAMSKADETVWNHTVGSDSWRFSKDTKKPAKATIKKHVIASSKSTKVVDSAKVNEWVRKLNTEDMDEFKRTIKSDDTHLIKILGFRYEKPFLIISAIDYEAERDVNNMTRERDGVKSIEYSFKLGYDKKGKCTPDMLRLKNFLEKKVKFTKTSTIASLLEVLVGEIVTVSNNMMVYDKKLGKDIYNPDFLGFPTYSFDEQQEYSYTVNNIKGFDKEFRQMFR